MTTHPLPATGSVTVSVAAPPSALWTFVSDPEAPTRFSAELVAASLVEGAQSSVGAVIEGTNRRGEAEWTTRSTVVACEEPVRFAWATGEPEAPAATWSFEVAEAAGGASLTHSVVLHPGAYPLGPAIEADPEHGQEIVDGRMADLLVSMEAVATGIARLAEGAG